jgi:transposase
MDYRKRAVAYKQEGHTFKQLREAFTPVKRERRRKIDKAALRQAVADKPDAFLTEYAEQFGCTATAVFYALEKLGITRKKSHSHITKNPKTAGRGIRQR